MTASESPRPVAEPCSRPGEATTPASEGAHAVAPKPVREAQAVGSPPSPGPRTFTVALPPGTELLTSNRMGKSWQKRHRIGTDIRDTVIWLCRQQRIPHLERVRIVVEFCPPPGRKRIVREAHNLAPSAKPGIDGLTKAGVLTDDSDRYVAGVEFVCGPVRPRGQLLLHVHELPEENS